MSTAKEVSLLDRVLGWVEKGCTFISGFSLVLMMLWISIDTSTRYLFNSPIPGTSEFVEEYLMVTLVFLALSFTFTQGGHVQVTLFLRFLPKKSLRWVNMFVNLLGLALFVLLTFASWKVAFRAGITHEVTNSILKYPMAPALFMVPLGSASLALRLIQTILESIGVIKTSEHEKVEFAEI